ncbi:GNAT family N-acetyltransferase [Micromonospora krabiensis]|uniref:Protein N-acetyltransferase, RimJ/RimL family n=1 Tax=Micromonospora krabiensis TaxID=307121 RepID=A0A1C3MZ36_9ACTN|nr:GNAT family N-acetyltransferase [Micromonospora krabiensis]SBV25575.1 Protein N-acetyltransferase, RimJ/RimL family [Micromonospora krabiensis]
MPSLVTPALAPGSLARLTQPEIDGHGVRLRPWRRDDGPAVVAGYADPAIRRWHCRSMTLDEARSWIDTWPRRWRSETGAGWAVVDADNPGGVLGQISLRRLDLAEGLAEVSYWVLPAARGRRVAPSALTALARWSFTVLRLHRVELAHSTANPASCRVAERAGFAAEGTKRAEALHTDGWHDMHLHARLASDGTGGPVAPAAEGERPVPTR